MAAGADGTAVVGFGAAVDWQEVSRSAASSATPEFFLPIRLTVGVIAAVNQGTWSHGAPAIARYEVSTTRYCPPPASIRDST